MCIRDSEHCALGVDDVPGALNVGGFRGEGPHRSSVGPRARRVPAQGEQEIVRLPGPLRQSTRPWAFAAARVRPYPGAMTQVESVSQTEDALGILLSADLE